MTISSGKIISKDGTFEMDLDKGVISMYVRDKPWYKRWAEYVGWTLIRWADR